MPRQDLVVALHPFPHREGTDMPDRPHTPSSSLIRTAVVLVAGMLATWNSVPAHVEAQPPASVDDAEAKAIIASAYTTSKNNPLTVEHCSQVIALCEQAQQKTDDPKLTIYIKQLTAWAHNKRGERYLQRAGQKEDQQDATTAQAFDAQAFKDFAAAIAQDPQHWKAYHNRGVCRAIAGEATQAIADFTQTVQLKKDYANAWFNRAELYLDLKKYDAAIADYTEVLKLNTTDVTAMIARGDARLMLRQHQQAIADYTQAIQLAPENPMPLVQRGTAHREMGQWKAARLDYNKALRMKNPSAQAYQHSAWLLATCPDEEIRNAELAIQVAEKAKEVATDPDWVLSDTLAAAYANANRFEDAVTQVNEAIAQAPKEETAALKGRLALYQAGKPFRDSFLAQ